MFTATDWIRDKNGLMVLTPFPIKWAGKAAKQVYHKLRQKDTGNEATSRTFLQRKGSVLVQPLSLTSFDKAGLRHPASAALRLRLAGRCPNNSSLFPPLAAVVAVALWQWQRNDYFLFAAEKSLRAFLCCFFTRGGVTSKCIKEHKCSLPVLPHSVKMCLERPAGRDKHKQ